MFMKLLKNIGLFLQVLRDVSGDVVDKVYLL